MICVSKDNVDHSVRKITQKCLIFILVIAFKNGKMAIYFDIENKMLTLPKLELEVLDNFD